MTLHVTYRIYDAPSWEMEAADGAIMSLCGADLESSDCELPTGERDLYFRFDDVPSIQRAKRDVVRHPALQDIGLRLLVKD